MKKGLLVIGISAILSLGLISSPVLATTGSNHSVGAHYGYSEGVTSSYYSSHSTDTDGGLSETNGYSEASGNRIFGYFTTVHSDGSVTETFSETLEGFTKSYSTTTHPDGSISCSESFSQRS